MLASARLRVRIADMGDYKSNQADELFKQLLAEQKRSDRIDTLKRFAGWLLAMIVAVSILGSLGAFE